MKDTILVTGGAGYIGSQFCKVASRYYNIVVYDNLSTGLKDFVKWGELVVGDLNNYELLVGTFKKYNPIAVIHFAASIEVGESVLNPIKYYDNNVVNTLNLLKAMINCNIKNIIFSSSAAIFGLADAPILNENTVKNPLNAYGRSKYIVEQILEDYKNSYGLNYTCLRYFNASASLLALNGLIAQYHILKSVWNAKCTKKRSTNARPVTIRAVAIVFPRRDNEVFISIESRLIPCFFGRAASRRCAASQMRGAEGLALQTVNCTSMRRPARPHKPRSQRYQDVALRVARVGEATR